jgi:DNA-binding NarL/FixJ family response regulator
MKPLRIVVADNHAVWCAGLTLLLNTQPGMAVVGEAHTAPDAIAQVEALQPDMLLMDVTMPGGCGASATAHLTRACPHTRVLVLTAYEEGEHVRHMRQAGAAGYVLKRAAVDDLVQAIRTVMAGGMYLDPAVVGSVVRAHLSLPPPAEAMESKSLSARESDVLRLRAWGHGNKEIAAQLGVSTKTVETYKARLMDKLHLYSRVDLVRYAVQQGWLRDP